MTPQPTIAERMARSYETERVANDELKLHTPTKDAYGELCCEKCADAAPCPRARHLMDVIYHSVRFRIVSRARGLA